MSSLQRMLRTADKRMAARDELRWVVDPQEVYGSDFPGETFRVLKEKELKAYGEYRTRRLVLEKWDQIRGEK